MLNYGELLDKIALIREKHSLISLRFSEFKTHIERFAKEIAEKPLDLPELPDLLLNTDDPGVIRVKFLERELRICKSFIPVPGNDYCGRLACSLVLDTDSVDIINIDFTTVGLTPIESGRPGEFVSINNRTHAINLFLDILYRSFVI
jgi:hypothetical protein